MTQNSRVTKTTLVKHVAEELDLDDNLVERVLMASLTSIAETVVGGGSVNITNFGTFKPHTTPEGLRRNPSTGGTILLPSRKRMKFSPSKTMIGLLNTSDPKVVLRKKSGRRAS